MSKPTQRRGYHHGDLRSALLDAATALVRQHGPSGFSLREAARDVGVDPAACYRHFRDRSDLLVAIAQRGFERLAVRMKRATAAQADESWDARLVGMGKVYVRFACEHPAEFRVMFGESGTHSRDPRLRPPALERSPYEQLEDLIRGWSQAHGIQLDVTRVALSFWSGAHGVARLVVDGALALSPAEGIALAEQVAELLVAGHLSSAGGVADRPGAERSPAAAAFEPRRTAKRARAVRPGQRK
jgi:AcrR family transcriptional regulator